MAGLAARRPLTLSLCGLPFGLGASLFGTDLGVAAFAGAFALAAVAFGGAGLGAAGPASFLSALGGFLTSPALRFPRPRLFLFLPSIDWTSDPNDLNAMKSFHVFLPVDISLNTVEGKVTYVSISDFDLENSEQ